MGPLREPRVFGRPDSWHEGLDSMIDVESRPAVSHPGAAARPALARGAAWARARDLHFALPVIAALLGLMLAPVLAQRGWPLNHEELAWKYRLLTYVAHFRRLELLPIWCESAAYGLGAPAPVLYHKLFYIVAAAWYLLTGSVKLTLLAAIGSFSLLGLLGQRALLRRLGVPARAALVAAAAFWFCNYSYTDWVVRSAFAEYSALQLLPWLFYWSIGVLSDSTPRTTFRQGALLFPALYLAHTVLFFFAAVPVASALAWRLARGADRRAIARALLGMGAIFAAVTLPIVVCQLAVVGELNFAEGIASFQPQDSYATLAEHLTGGSYVWGATQLGYSVQLDIPLLIAALLGLLQVCWRAARRRLAPASAWPAGGRLAYTACWLWAGYYAFLLSPASAPLYRSLPGFAMLQFPWRLLSFVAVASVALAAYPWLARAQGGRNAALGGACWLLLVTYAVSPWLHPIRYAWFPASELEGPPPPATQFRLAGFEYHPRVPGVAGADIIRYTQGLSPSPDERLWHTGDYSVERVDDPAFEKGERLYHVRSTTPAAVTLPIAYSPFIHVEAVRGKSHERLATRRTPSDPRVCFDVSAGELDVLVKFPTLLSLYRDLLAGVR
jgi:hypothetical protein